MRYDEFVETQLWLLNNILIAAFKIIIYVSICLSSTSAQEILETTTKKTKKNVDNCNWRCT